MVARPHAGKTIRGRSSPVRKGSARPSGGSGTAASSDSPRAGGTEPQVIVPQTNNDPVWSLCLWPVDVKVHGAKFEIPPMPAVDWLKFLMAGPAPDLFGLVTELMPDLEDFFFDEGLPFTELYDVVHEVLSTVSARHWWIALRLAHLARLHWHILGPQLMTQGIDATKLSLAAWLDVLLYTLIENMQPDKVAMFTLQLEAPPKAEGAATPDLMETMTIDRNAFLALA